MFEWLCRFFNKKPAPSQYAVLVRGQLVYESQSIEDAEEYIRLTFEDVDAQMKGGRSWSKHNGLKKHSRWTAYRSQIKIVKITD